MKVDNVELEPLVHHPRYHRKEGHDGLIVDVNLPVAGIPSRFIFLQDVVGTAISELNRPIDDMTGIMFVLDDFIEIDLGR